MAAHDAKLGVETWRVRERALPRVPPAGWGTVDRLREAVCLVVMCTVDGVEAIESFEGPAAERERFNATVTTDSINHEHVDLLRSASSGSSTGDASDSSESTDRGGENFQETTEQFDLDDALDRL